MTTLRWQESLSLDVPAIDRDHKRLIELTNRIHYMTVAGDDRQALARVLEEIVAYTQTHFRREEMLMRLSGYPRYEAHRRTHAAFTAKVDDLYEQFRRRPHTFDIDAFARLINDWLTMHILGEDMKIKPFVAQLAEAHAA
jgi:hemerythrin